MDGAVCHKLTAASAMARANAMRLQIAEAPIMQGKMSIATIAGCESDVLVS
jgi:hypothetical protein